MYKITRVERINKIYGEPLEVTISDYLEELIGEIVVDIKFYTKEGEIMPTTAYLFISKVKE